MVERVDRSATIEKMNRFLALPQERLAVVTIDCQRGNLDPTIASLPVPEAQCQRVMSSTNQLIGMARQHDVPIVHVSTVFEDPLLATHPFEQAMLELKQSFSPHTGSDFKRHKSPGSIEGQLMPDLDVQPQDLLVEGKRTFDSFEGTPLALLLTAMRRDTLLIAGCNTNTCVLSTVFGAYNRRFRAVVIEDCVASAYGDDLHAFALENVRRRLGWVLTLAELNVKLADAAASRAQAQPQEG